MNVIETLRAASTLRAALYSYAAAHDRMVNLAIEAQRNGDHEWAYVLLGIAARCKAQWMRELNDPEPRDG